jgi:putative ABC transport system permease protein
MIWLWRHVTHGLRALFRRGEADRDLSDEMRHYLEEAEAELRAAGLSREEARRRVRLRYGDGLSAREDVRAYGWENTVGAFVSDVRLALRRLRRSPGFTLVAVLSLGVGIGAATAIFSAVRPVLFEPLPYPNAELILSISDRTADGSLAQATFGTYREIFERNVSFEVLAVVKPWQPSLTGNQEPERLEAQRVSAGYFDVLGVAPVLGRGFDASADRPGGGDVVILSDDLWRRRFEADPMIVGRVVYLDSQAYSVVGVMPAGFENVSAPMVRAWALMQYDPTVVSFDTREWGHHLDLFGRLREGVEIEQARASLGAIAEHAVEEFPRPTWASLENGFLVRPLRDATTAGARPTMLVLMGAVSLLVVITCVNLTILLLARGSRRGGELAMRVALGAGRARLVRQLLTESLLLAVLGGLLGVVVARIGLAGLMMVSPPSLPGLETLGLDRVALGFAFGVTTLVGVMFGLAPALVRSGGRTSDALRHAGRGSVDRSRSARQALVVAEVSLAMVLLIGAGLLLRSTQRLFSIPPGFDPSGTVVLQVYATGLERGDAATHRFFDQALEAVQGVPGVGSAALTSQLPLSGDIDAYGLTLDDVGRAPGADGTAFRYAVSPEYFTTMGMLLERGRALESVEPVPAAVVSESLARRLFADRDPIGGRFHLGATDGLPYSVVGVVGDVKQASLDDDQPDAVYVRSAQWHWADRVRWLVVRTEHDPEALVPAIRRAVWAVDSDQPIVRVQSMERVLARSEAQRRFVLTILVAFGLSALALAGVGLYGVLSGSVTERLREIGVRAALGASREDIVALVVHQGMTLTALGIAIGLAGAVAASEALVTLLFGTTRLDLPTYVGVAALLIAVSGIASWVPAARAARVDPLQTLRAE